MMEVHIHKFSWSRLSFMIREANAQKPRPIGFDDSINGGNISNTTCFMILEGIEVFQIAKHRSQKPGPITIGLNRDLLLHIPRISCFIKPAEVGSPSKEFNPDQIRDLRPASTRVVHNPSLLVHAGTVIKPLVQHTWVLPNSTQVSQWDSTPDKEDIQRSKTIRVVRVSKSLRHESRKPRSAVIGRNGELMVESFAISDPVRFWPGKKFNLEHNLESALHPGLHVISPKVLIKKSR